MKADPFKVPAWKKVLMANDPQNFTKPSAAPLLMIQGGSDEQIPVVSTQILAKHLCNIGQDLERWIYPGQSHAGVIGPSANDMIHWIADRFAGVANPDPYVPTGLRRHRDHGLSELTRRPVDRGSTSTGKFHPHLVARRTFRAAVPYSHRTSAQDQTETRP